MSRSILTAEPFSRENISTQQSYIGGVLLACNTGLFTPNVKSKEVGQRTEHETSL